MINNKLLIALLSIFSVISFQANGLAVNADKSWEASPELAEALTKRRPEINYYEQAVPK